MKISDLGEFGLIDLIRKELPLYSPAVVKGIGDDTAVLKVNDSKLQLMTTDMMVEGIHFSYAYATPWQVGAKALNVNISDIAAMGGEATNATVAIGLPQDFDAGAVQEIYRGIGAMAARYNVNIVGGDTVSSPVMMINVTLLGEVAPSKVIYRSGARPGDMIFVTGPLGGSAAGLFHLQHPDFGCPQASAREITELHLVPTPRVKEAKYISESGLVTSMNDISDGLASELHEICTASKMGCQIYEDKIPVNKSAEALAESTGQNALEWALYGGEDYQLVFTVPQKHASKLAGDLRDGGSQPVYIGEMTPAAMVLIDKQGKKLPFSPRGYDHFSKR